MRKHCWVSSDTALKFHAFMFSCQRLESHKQISPFEKNGAQFTKKKSRNFETQWKGQWKKNHTKLVAVKTFSMALEDIYDYYKLADHHRNFNTTNILKTKAWNK